MRQRNVTPIDLAPLVKEISRSDRHAVATTLLIKALIRLKPPSPFKWDSHSVNNLSRSNSNDPKIPCKIYAMALRQDRVGYPGWVVAPKQARWTAFTAAEAYRSNITESDSSQLLSFAAERIWYYRISNHQISHSDIEIVDKYYDNEKSALSLFEQRALCTAMAFVKRKYQQWEEWARWLGRLDEIGDTEAVLCRRYEEALRAQLDWNDTALAKAAEDLRSDQPIWMMRRASLLAALYRDKEAAEIYETALREVRTRLISAPNSPFLISLESWASMFYKTSFSALQEGAFTAAPDESDATRLRFAKAQANSWEIIEDFDRLSSQHIERNRIDNTEWQLGFEPGHYGPGGVTRVGGEHECPFYGLIEVMERIGAPAGVANVDLLSSRLEKAYLSLAKPDEQDLSVLLSRVRGSYKNQVDKIMRRVDVALLSEEFACRMLPLIRARIDRLIIGITEFDVFGYKSNYIASLLELMSRIIVRSSQKEANNCFEWGVKFTKDRQFQWTCYKPLNQLLKRSLASMSAEERARSVAGALMLPLPWEGGDCAREDDWPEIIDEFSDSDISEFQMDPQVKLRIEYLIQYIKNDENTNRDQAIIRLHRLYKGGKLSVSQVDKFRIALWSSVNEKGFPNSSRLLPWFFLDLPGAEMAESLFVIYVIKPSIENSISPSMMMSLRAGLSLLSGEINNKDLVLILKKYFEWLPEAPPDDPFRAAFMSTSRSNSEISRQIGYAICSIIKAIDDSDNILEEIKDDWLLALNRLKVSTMPATTFYLARRWPEQLSFAIQIIRSAVASREPENVNSAYYAIENFIAFNLPDHPLPRQLRELILDAIDKREQPGLIFALKLACQLVESKLLDTSEIERLISSVRIVINEYNYDQKYLSIPSLASMPLVRRQSLRLIRLLIVYEPSLELLLKTLEADPLPEVRSA